jgi:hypothetical protein
MCTSAENCVLSLPVFNSDVKDALFGLHTQITIVFIINFFKNDLHNYIIIQNKWHRGRLWKFKFTLATRPLLNNTLVSMLLVTFAFNLALILSYIVCSNKNSLAVSHDYRDR